MESFNNISDWPTFEEEKSEILTLPDETSSQLINLDSGNYVQINHINNNPVTDLKWPQDEFTWQYCNEQYQPQIQQQQVFYNESAHQQHFYYNQNGQEQTQQMNVHDQKVPINNMNYEHLNNRSVASTSGTQRYNNYNIDYMLNNNRNLETTQQQFLYIDQQAQQQQQQLYQQQHQYQPVPNYQVIAAPIEVAPLRAQTVSPADSGISSTTASSASSSSNACTTSQGKNSRVNCPKCDRTFAKQCYLKQHQKTAHVILPFHCRKCGKKYKTQELLDNHIDRHNAIDKPYKCLFILEKGQCEKQFFHSTDLRRHMISHTDIKPHVCDICNKDFTRRDHMLNHKRTHRKRKN